MIEIVGPENRALYEDALEAMFRMRYKVFVNDWGWNIPGLNGSRDCDAFDTDNTVYFIERAQDTNDVIACARINPTTKPHMFTELFAHLCDLQPVQLGPDIVEASRFAIDRDRVTRRDLLRIKGQMEWAVTWYCLRNSVSKMTWLMSKDVYARYVQFWKTAPLGMPVYFEDDNQTYIPAVSEISHAALARISKRYNLCADGPICIQAEQEDRVEVYPVDHAAPDIFRPAA